MQKFRVSRILNQFREYISDLLTDAVGTWTFVIIYSLLIFIWIWSHQTNRLNYDLDLTYLNFFLCWLSGIQASIIMMSDSRKEEKHFEATNRDLEVGEKVLASELKSNEIISKMSVKINSMVNKISKLEEIIELMELEEQEKINAKHQTKFRGEN